MILDFNKIKAKRRKLNIELKEGGLENVQNKCIERSFNEIINFLIEDSKFMEQYELTVNPEDVFFNLAMVISEIARKQGFNVVDVTEIDITE